MNCLAQQLVYDKNNRYLYIKILKIRKKLEPANDIKIINVRKIFNDIDHFNAAVKKWSLDFRQMDSGKFEGELMLLDMEQLQVSHTHLNRLFEQKATTPVRHRTFGIPADNEQSFIWRGHKIRSNNLLIVPKSCEVEAVSYPGFNLFTVSIAENQIETYRESLQSKEIKLLDKGIEVLALSENSMKIIQHKFHYLFKRIDFQPELVHNRTFQRIFYDEITSAILNIFFDENSIVALPSKRIRDISLKKSVDYINSCRFDFPSVVELCQISGASLRTLEYAFKEKYRIGPKDYMKKRALNNVREALKTSMPGQVLIKDIAYEYGFFHLGQFGADYKKLFGELPTVTLNKEKKLQS